MSIEHKIIIIDSNSLVAEFDLASVGYGEALDTLCSLFTEEISYPHIYAVGYADELTHDCYGKELKAAPIDKVIEWLRYIIQKDNYRRYKPLLALLEGFDQSEWFNLRCVHFQY